MRSKSSRPAKRPDSDALRKAVTKSGLAAIRPGQLGTTPTPVTASDETMLDDPASISSAGSGMVEPVGPKTEQQDAALVAANNGDEVVVDAPCCTTTLGSCEGEPIGPGEEEELAALSLAAIGSDASQPAAQDQQQEQADVPSGPSFNTISGRKLSTKASPELTEEIGTSAGSGGATELEEAGGSQVLNVQDTIAETSAVGATHDMDGTTGHASLDDGDAAVLVSPRPSSADSAASPPAPLAARGWAMPGVPNRCVLS